MKLLTAIQALMLVIASVSADTSAYIRRLVRGGASDSHFPIDDEQVFEISNYSVKFSQCQTIHSYDSKIVRESRWSTDVLAAKHFVVFRLCPSTGSGNQQGCEPCTDNYGEYLVDLDTYLESAVVHFQDDHHKKCNACYEQCQISSNNSTQNNDNYNNNNYYYNGGGNNNNNGNNYYNNNNNNYNSGGNYYNYNGNNQGEEQVVPVTSRSSYWYDDDPCSCLNKCEKIERMEENGYIDATNFLQCQMIYGPADDDQEVPLYAGPMCAAGGSKINIGVFKDEDCKILDPNKKVDDYLIGYDGYQMRLSHALFKKTYQDTCVSCLDPSIETQVQVRPMCKQLYETAAKCELAHGFKNEGIADSKYKNQATQEEFACDFIQQLNLGEYNERGEIRVNGESLLQQSSSSVETHITSGQIYTFSFLVPGLVLLLALAALLQRMVTKVESKAKQEDEEKAQSSNPSRKTQLDDEPSVNQSDSGDAATEPSST